MSLVLGQMYHLVSGPSKYDLMPGLFDGRGSTQRTLRFVTNTGQGVDVRVQGIQREDGSAESWIFDGFVTSEAGDRAHGYFHTQKRQGHITITK